MEYLSNSGVVTYDRLDSCIIRCERTLEEIGNVEPAIDIDSSLNDLYASIDHLIVTLHDSQVLFQRQTVLSSLPPRQPAHRPHLDIDKKQLQFLLQCEFRFTEITELFRCSAKTVQRRVREYNLTTIAYFTDVSDEELDTLADEYVKHFPMAGTNSYQAFLLSQGLKVPRHQVRESMIRVDGEGVASRR